MTGAGSQNLDGRQLGKSGRPSRNETLRASVPTLPPSARKSKRQPHAHDSGKARAARSGDAIGARSAIPPHARKPLPRLPPRTSHRQRSAPSPGGRFWRCYRRQDPPSLRMLESRSQGSHHGLPIAIPPEAIRPESLRPVPAILPEQGPPSLCMLERHSQGSHGLPFFSQRSPCARRDSGPWESWETCGRVLISLFVFLPRIELKRSLPSLPTGRDPWKE